MQVVGGGLNTSRYHQFPLAGILLPYGGEKENEVVDFQVIGWEQITQSDDLVGIGDLDTGSNMVGDKADYDADVDAKHE